MLLKLSINELNFLEFNVSCTLLNGFIPHLQNSNRWETITFSEVCSTHPQSTWIDTLRGKTWTVYFEQIFISTWLLVPQLLWLRILSGMDWFRSDDELLRSDRTMQPYIWVRRGMSYHGRWDGVRSRLLNPFNWNILRFQGFSTSHRTCNIFREKILLRFPRTSISGTD